MLRRTFFALPAASLLAQTPPSAQKPAEPASTAGTGTSAASTTAQTTFRTQVNEVIVPVTVTDSLGRFVSDLDAKDFQIFDEGKPQSIRFFTRDQKQPVVVGFLLDLSNANRIHWRQYKEAAIELVLALLPGEQKYSGYLVSYGNEAELQVNTTHLSDRIVEKLEKLKPGGGAALYDAIYMACTSRNLVKGEPIEPRRIIVVIGDGHDSASRKTLDEVLELAQRNLVTVYGVSTQAFGFSAEGDKNLRRLCEETGGRVEYPLEGIYKDVAGFLSTPSDEGNYALKVGTGAYAAAVAKGMFGAIANVAGEVTTQYILRYIPDGEPKPFRNIRVEVNLPNVKVRARKGYYQTL